MNCTRCGTQIDEEYMADRDRGLCSGCAADELDTRVDMQAEQGEEDDEELEFEHAEMGEDMPSSCYGLHFREDTGGATEVIDKHNNFLGYIQNDELGRFCFYCPPDISCEMTTWNILGLAGRLQECNDIRM